MQRRRKQLRGTAIGTKFVPPYAIIFMTDLEERILKGIELKLRICGGISMIYFSYRNMEKIL